MNWGAELDKSQQYDEEVARRAMLSVWQDRAIRANLAHYFQSQEYRTIAGVLTVFNLIAGISVLFLANNRIFAFESESYGQIALSVAGLAVVLGSALQYVLRLDDKIHSHKMAGNAFTSIKRKIEISLSSGSISIADIKEIATDHDHTSKNFPLVRQTIWTKIERRYLESKMEDRHFLRNVGVNSEESDGKS